MDTANITVSAYDGRVDVQIGDSIIVRLTPDSAAKLAFTIMEARDLAEGVNVSGKTEGNNT